MFSWRAVRASNRHGELVESGGSLDELLDALRLLAWEEPGNDWVNILVDETTGQVAAVAIFGPRMGLMVSFADGRRECFPMPESYRKSLGGWAVCTKCLTVLNLPTEARGRRGKCPKCSHRFGPIGEIPEN